MDALHLLARAENSKGVFSSAYASKVLAKLASFKEQGAGGLRGKERAVFRSAELTLVNKISAEIKIWFDAALGLWRRYQLGFEFPLGKVHELPGGSDPRLAQDATTATTHFQPVPGVEAATV